MMLNLNSLPVMRRSFLFAILISLSSLAWAQTPVEPPDDDATEQKIEKIAEEAGEEVDANTLLDKLNYYRENKIDLNKTNREELRDLLLLNDIQIEALLKHMNVEGDLISLTEMQTIDELDQETILRILPFVTINTTGVFEKFSMQKIFKDGKHTILIRV